MSHASPSSSPLPQGPTRNHFKPYLSDLLESLAVNVAYHRGCGDLLYYRDPAGEEIEVLDLVGGYGSLLLGHSHPEIVREAQQFLAEGGVCHAQGSRRSAAELLARELSARCGGDYMAIFGNSGAEAVEAALKHAMLETGGNHFIVLKGAFHGKTSGALQLTANETYRAGMKFGGVPVTRVPINDLARLSEAFSRAKNLAGFIYEPIQGEGGIHPLDAAFVQAAADLCQRHGVPLIADECQTGLGRTGLFLGSDHLGVKPDYVLLSKSLGGGVAKIGALLVQRRRYCDSFDLKHTSTYADDDFSCAIARKVLELVDDNLLRQCAASGMELQHGLRSIATNYPEIIADVRGRGLMIGVELKSLTSSASFLLRQFSSQRHLGLLVMGYLLRRHGIRIAPTLSDPFTLRLEPSAFISLSNISRFLSAMEDVCIQLKGGKAAVLSAHLSSEALCPRLSDTRQEETRIHIYEAERLEAGLPERRPLVPMHPGSQPEVDEAIPLLPRKVAWLCHLMSADDLSALDEDFAEICLTRRERLLARLARFGEPVVLSSVDVASARGNVVRLFPIMVPFTSHWVKAAMEARRTGLGRAMVQEAVDVAAGLGCDLVALGQYTSIVTHNGLTLNSRGLGLTTGNSYAVALVLEALERACAARAVKPEAATLVVVGAAGNIGRICATCLAPYYRQTLLLGSPGRSSTLRLRRMARELPRATFATALSATLQGQVVIAATNAVDAPLHAAHLRVGAIVCDLSVPSSLTQDAAKNRPDIALLRGGRALLPGGEDLKIPGFPLPRGEIYGCMGEALLCGWEGVRDRSMIGALTLENVRKVGAMAIRHGLCLANDAYSPAMNGATTRSLQDVNV